MKSIKLILRMISCLAVLLGVSAALAEEVPVPRAFDTLCSPARGERSAPVYSQPKTSSDKLMTLSEGETLTVVGDTGKYYLVEAEEQRGYVLHEKVRLSAAPGTGEIGEAIDENAALVDAVPFRKETHLELAGSIHAPDKLRCNRVLQTLPEFYTTYGIRPGDGMWTAPETRVSVW